MPIQFNTNPRTAIEAVLWILQNGVSDADAVWNALFAAEKYRLNHYGGPITGDNYIAVKGTAVPTWLNIATRLTDCKLGFRRDGDSLIAERAPNMDYLAEADIEALAHGVREYSAGFDGEKTPIPDGDETPILFEDLIEEEWLKEDLMWMSRSMVI